MERIPVRLLAKSWRGAVGEVVLVPWAMAAAMLSCGLAEYVDEEEARGEEAKDYQVVVTQ